MTLIEVLREIKYQIADKLFCKEMDEAYSMGIRVGAEYAARTISFRVDVKESRQDLTKTQKIGYDKAYQIIQDCKPDIEKTTGATL